MPVSGQIGIPTDARPDEPKAVCPSNHHRTIVISVRYQREKLTALQDDVTRDAFAVDRLGKGVCTSPCGTRPRRASRPASCATPIVPRGRSHGARNADG